MKRQNMNQTFRNTPVVYEAATVHCVVYDVVYKSVFYYYYFHRPHLFPKVEM